MIQLWLEISLGVGLNVATITMLVAIYSMLRKEDEEEKKDV
jgi:hypothetical protein